MRRARGNVCAAKKGKSMEDRNREWEPLRAFLQAPGDPAAGRAFAGQCLALDADTLKERLAGHLEDDAVRALLLKKCPQLYFGRDMEGYFQHWQYRSVEALFRQRYRDGFFDRSAARGFGEWVAAHDVSPHRASLFFRQVDWKAEPEADICFLIRQAKAKQLFVREIIAARPGLLFADPEVCGSLTRTDLADMSLKNEAADGGRVDFLVRHASPQIRSDILRAAGDGALCRSEEALPMLPKDRLLRLLRRADWGAMSPQEVFRLLDTALSRGLSVGLYQICSALDWSGLPPEEARRTLQEALSRSFPEEVLRQLAGAVNWGRETPEELRLLLETAPAGLAEAVVQSRPELLFSGIPVVGRLGDEALRALPLESLLDSPERLESLPDSDRLRRAVCGAARDEVLLRCPAVWKYLTEERFAALLAGGCWRAETEGFHEQMIVQAKRCGFDAGPVLAFRPGLLYTSWEVCGCIDAGDLSELPLAELVRTPDQLQTLTSALTDDPCDYLLEHVGTETLLQTEAALGILPEAMVCGLVEGIDWNDPEGPERYGLLLSSIEADQRETAALRIAESMRNQGAAFSPAWWERFTDSVKIRILIYSSNFPEERERWFEPLRAVHQMEQARIRQEAEERERWQEAPYRPAAVRDSRLVLAALKFFVNIYPQNQQDMGRFLKNFLEAHDLLMTYICSCFSSGSRQDVTHGLNTLLDKCRDRSCRGSVYFCDARRWQKKNGIFCPEGRARPGGGRLPCGYYKTPSGERHMDLTQTAYRSGSGSYQDQALADLLLNVGVYPAVSLKRDLDIDCPEEYPYRIAAFVDRLIDMRPHLRCRKCGCVTHPDFRYSRLVTAKLSTTVFNCPNAGQEEGHDADIYLNYCYHCHRVIDKRECRRRARVKQEGRTYDGHYLCMRCGATGKFRVGGVEYQILHGEMCPSCGTPGQVEKIGRERMKCHACNYDSRTFVSWFEQTEGPTVPVPVLPGTELPW